MKTILSIGICFLFTLFFPATLASQEPLEIRLMKARSQNLLSDSAKIYLQELAADAKRLKEYNYEAEANYLLGKHFFLLMHDAQARSCFHRARVLFTEDQNWEKAGFSNIQLGLSYLQENMLDSSLLSFQYAIELYQAHDLKKNLWTPYMGISSVYSKEGNIPNAFKYAKLAVEVLQYSNARTSKIVAINHLLNLARDQDSLAIYAHYTNTLYQLYSPLEMDERIIQHIDHYIHIEDPQIRIKSILGALDRLHRWPMTLEQVSMYYHLGKTYLELHDIPKGLEALKTAYALERDSLHSIHFAPALLRLLSDQYESTGDYRKALHFHKTYSQLKDSLTVEYNKARTEELQLKFEATAKDNEIAEQQLVLARRTFQRNAIVALALLLFIVGIYLYFSQRRYMRDKATITMQQEILHEKEVLDLKKKHEVANLHILVHAQEEERKRIAQDLHDSLGGLVAILKIKLRQLGQRSNPENLEIDTLEQMQLIDAVGAEVRRIAHNMMPPALAKMGLSAAIEDLVNAMQQNKQLNISYQNIDYDQSLGLEKEINLYRIVQELCANVIKHAQATQLIIQLSRHNGTATLVVEDNGNGMKENDGYHAGMGISSVRSRVKFLEAEMEIHSTLGEGTSITINVPVR